MSFSFIDIERKKSRVIAFLFLFLILIYFITAYLLLIVIENTFLSQLFSGRGSYAFFFPPFKHVLITFILAFNFAFLHWSYSTGELIERLAVAAGAMPIDPQDTYHQYFNNIIDEVSVALGGRKIEPWVIHSSSMNAFALEDFKGRALIGVTEGLLARLNRAQIEAVVGHEAGHIASGDCLSTTVSCALAEIYEESLSDLKTISENTDRRNVPFFLLLIGITLILMRFLSTLLRSFISREKELRADAIGVRLTRDPLSLAEALKLITRGWRGEGTQGENLQSIFILNPRFDELDEEEGILSDLFSTHPPVRKRINILLAMAHLDEKTLEDNLKDFKRVSPVAKPEFPSEYPSGEINITKRWGVFKDGKWQGPFTLEELISLGGLLPTQWVRPEGKEEVSPAWEQHELKTLFMKSSGQTGVSGCPNCKVKLQAYQYEGVPVLKCNYCQGVFVEDDKVSRILIREDYVPSPEIERLAKIIADSQGKTNLKKVDPKSMWIIYCPKCNSKMCRQFFVYSYPVEIDRCVGCAGIWFDKDELEVLQYIYQHKEKFLYGQSSF